MKIKKRLVWHVFVYEGVCQKYLCERTDRRS